VEFVSARDAEIFESIPPAPAVYLVRGNDPQSDPYISKTANLRRRLQRLLGTPTEHTKKLNLRDLVRWIEYTPTGSDFESGLLLYRVLRSVFPGTYSDRLRLRFAPLIKLHLENEYPRASITTRLGRLNGRSLYYGPFFSRSSAEKFANDSLDFFKMRRCVEDLHPDPKFPGCIYSEMKMCLAPCFQGCTDQDYEQEVGRVQAYFQTKGDSLLRQLSTQRDHASSNMEFEEAAALHARVDKLKSQLGQLPEIVHRLDLLDGVMVQPSASAGCVNLFRIHAAQIFGPGHFPIQAENQSKSQSMEARIQEALSSIPLGGGETALEVMEHLALLRRWFYRSSRIGEIFFADDKSALPLRRIVRGISRVYRGERVEPQNYHAGASVPT
jgi:excinuclease UvrABC nuclease subunit